MSNSENTQSVHHDRMPRATGPVDSPSDGHGLVRRASARAPLSSLPTERGAGNVLVAAVCSLRQSYSPTETVAHAEQSEWQPPLGR